MRHLLTSKRRLSAAAAVLLVVATTLLGLALVAQATVQALSEGCDHLNIPGYDTSYPGASEPMVLEAGEKISISAGAITIGETPTTIELKIDGSVVDSAAFPGAVEHIIQIAGLHTVSWGPDVKAFPIWTVSCSAAPPPDPTAGITDLKRQVAGLKFDNGITTALNSKLDEAIMALAADYTPGACDSLRAFQSQVAAQRQKKLSQAQAEQLTDAANGIRTLLDC